jgi:hypothetical protein
MITVYLSIDEAKELFDALEAASTAEEFFSGHESETVNEFIDNLGFRIEAADKS